MFLAPIPFASTRIIGRSTRKRKRKRLSRFLSNLHMSSIVIRARVRIGVYLIYADVLFLLARSGFVVGARSRFRDHGFGPRVDI